MGDMEGGSQGMCLEGDREQSASSLLAREANGGRPRRPPDAGHAGPWRDWQECPWGGEWVQDSPHWVVGGMLA